jgi:hypothetical protein
MTTPSLTEDDTDHLWHWARNAKHEPWAADVLKLLASHAARAERLVAELRKSLELTEATVRMLRSRVRMKYVLVPEEPTEAMIESALADHAENAPFDSPFGSRGSFASYYRAMISAAPSPPETAALKGHDHD